MSKQVIRQLECDEEEKILEMTLKTLTVRKKPICDVLGINADELSHIILSGLSHAGFKIVEGTCQ